MFEDQIAALEAREAELVPFLQGCLVGSRAQGTVCGLRVNEAPDPWLSADGRPCRGYSTRSTLEYDFCGYWSSSENPEAADDDTRLELLKVGPFCLDTEGSVLFCSSEAKRTQRSGIYELRYLARDDRAYCASRFVRERLTPEVHNESGCRAELQHRLELCGLECDVCKAECTSPAARTLVNSWKCGAGFPGLGMLQAFHESDIGQDISYRWSAQRTTGRPQNPEDSWQEQYRVLVQQNIDAPIAPRNAISCRRPHRESTYGSYVPPLKDDGTPIQRKGFMVPCTTDSDCYIRCGEHPITGKSYRCTHDLKLYTYAGVGFPNLGDPNIVAGLHYHNTAEGTPFYTVDYPGDNRFDVENHSVGVCTDSNVAYGITGCTSNGAARGIVATEGCSGRFFGWGRKFCGAMIENDHPDYVSGASISDSSLEYPRVLVPSTRVNGKEQLEVTCSNPDDCVLKCEFFSRVARDGGYPAPAACALCVPPCPDNGATTFVMGFQAFFHDFAKAMRLAMNCGLTLGLGQACLCEVWMLVRNAKSPHRQCSFSRPVALVRR